jgi:hypothetical protein
MKYIISLSGLIFSSYLTAQVGISTNTPQKALHVSGSVTSVPVSGTSVSVVNPTLRIDGLNKDNQGTTENLRPVSVSDNGDVVLSPALVKPLVMIDPINTTNTEKDYIPTAVTINQTSAATTTNAVIRSFSFKLTSPSLVKFSAVTSFQFQKASDGTPVTDGSNRTWGTRFRFSSAPSGISTAATSYFGESVRGYSNSTSNTTATGPFYTSSDDTLYLPAGDYTLDVNLYAATNTSQTPLRIIYGGGGDTISIVAYPVQ